MFCPECATPGVYIGLSVIECRNPACRHFKSDFGHPVLREYQKKFLAQPPMTNPCAEICTQLLSPGHGKTRPEWHKFIEEHLGQKVVVIDCAEIRGKGKAIIAETIRKESPCILILENIDILEELQ